MPSVAEWIFSQARDVDNVIADPGPIHWGAMVTQRQSKSDSARKDVKSVAPPSTMMEWIPKERFSKGSVQTKSIRPSANVGHDTNVHSLGNSLLGKGTIRSECRTSTFLARKLLEMRWMWCNCESNTMGRGWCWFLLLSDFQSRLESRGLSMDRVFDELKLRRRHPASEMTAVDEGTFAEQ